MEAAAKTVQQLTQRILPEKPHHLSYSPDWRYHIPASESRQKHPEEWDNTRLQYSTLVSEADRGVLLTRSYYDMRVEPPKPVPRDVGILAKGGEKKKLSLSDYKNKKTSGVTSDASTPEPPSAKKRELERTSADPRSVPEIRKPDSQRQKEQHPDTKSQKSRELPVVDMRLPPKPPASLPPRPVSPDSRKRTSNVDDDHRSQKRHRPDMPRPHDDRSRPGRDEPPRRKDRDSLAPSDIPPRDKPTSSSSLPNGRSILKSTSTSARNPSPAGRARGDSVNGVRPGASGSTKGTPNKIDNASRSSVPPLLSPLHLSWDSQNSTDKGDRRRVREDAADATKATKPKKLDPPPALKTKNDATREKSPIRLPALLSPTLPSSLEAELSRRKASTKATESKIQDDREKDESSEKQKRRLVVTLRISKRMRQTFKRILALPSKRRERSESTEAPSISQAKKRPASSDNTGDTIAVKRPRMPSVSASLPPPSTPSKKGAAMSRVSSSNSQAHTPGDSFTVTPVPLGSSDRPITNGTDAARDKADPRAIFDKHTRFSTLGRRLKHEGDVANQRFNKLSSSGDKRGADSSRKQYYALAVESTVAFMASFYLLNVGRNLQNKPSDPGSWASLIKMVDYLTNETRRDSRRSQPIYALILILQAITVDEFLKASANYENISKEELFAHQSTRYRNWPAVHGIYDGISSSRLRADIAPWSTVEEVCQASMRVVRHWCQEENVQWSPEFDPNEASIRVARQ
ncbi:hypothetical protein AU210_004315 [Fusarium oxysporum f. sp. radicis-cucumerinum]|uniref:Uncharacterized protein n=1 Tax=Fusarium oxysporum f. sp. radicis-cucumerinum TaxID=327505 RepID=A0A2H3HFQ8_FUSOX|nr:hypothetical protein AU210_004315 [Fusarium oxysporum f. sp. radicis-cucumerinum]